MGYRWFTSMLFVLAFSAFAEWGSSDSRVLNAIADNTETLQYELDRQSSSLGNIESDVEVITGAVWDIYDQLYDPVTTESIFSRLDRFATNFTFNVNREVNVYDPSNNYYQVQILDKLNQLISISSNSVASGLIYTNLPFAQSGYIGEDADDYGLILYYLESLGIDNPSAEQISQAANLLIYFSPQNFISEYLSRLDISKLDDEQFSLLDSFISFYSYYGYFNTESWRARLGSLYFDQYATKPILEFLQSLTNGVPEAADFYSSDDDGNPVLSARGSSFFSGLGSAFTGTVSTNIASISTNAIQQVENDSITGMWSDATRSDPSSGNLGAVVDSINNLSSGVSSTIQETFSVNPPDSFSLDFNVPVSVTSSDTRLYSYQLTSPLLKLRPYVSFFSALAKLLLALYFTGLIWVRVVKPLIGFHNAEDPF